ncbi:hydantoinase/oxoprolinase family protein [Granulicoccus phenolivorans]|uniref:hydantoinase/oxoprolinase family protein n=1 Tax=Granulicoccus phenolivorans TaxID=266854 RepID=UPI0004095CCF|nr:hydantoinase/oxoprolinase family protein [Granulicoccus phenolivorans]
MVAYRIGIDVGGTFTDFVAVPDDGSPILRHKVSSTPDEPARAVGLGMADLLEQLGEAPILTVTHGTTIGLNAIIQRRGGKVVLAVTEGFADLLEIGRSRMPDSFNLHAVGQQPLVHRDNVLQLRARLDPEGGIVRDSDDAELAATARRICELAPETVVVNLVNGYANPDFEQELAGRLARAITKHGGAIEVISAAALWPEIREYERCLVAVMGAHIHGTVKRYLEDLQRRLTGLGVTAPLFISASNGGSLSVEAAIARPIDTILSGPASGVTAARMHYPGQNLITFDMGGTSSDISIIVDGHSRLSTTTEVGGLALMLPVIDVSAIGAGGGSVIWPDLSTDQPVLEVGPESVGASPGPACYGLGGDRPAITDAYLATGMIDPGRFLGGTMQLYPDLATEALADATGQLGIVVADPATWAAGTALRLTTAQMATELQKLLAERALDAPDFTLVPFGGAGPTHATLLADELGISRLIVPDAAATYCALGAALAPLRRDYVHSVRALLDDATVAELQRAGAEILELGAAWLAANGDDPASGTVQVSLDMRYPGQAYELSVALGEIGLSDLASGRVTRVLDADLIRRTFNDEHELRYGFVHTDSVLEVGTLRIAIIGATVAMAGEEPRPRSEARPAPRTYRRVNERGQWVEAAVLDYGDLAIGAVTSGPAIVEHSDTTIVVPTGWTLQRLPNRDLELAKEGSR